MKRKILIVLLTATFFISCSYKQREEALKQKEEELNKREEELNVRENNVKLQEEEIKKLKQSLDSSTAIVIQDSGVINTDITGAWVVKMNCIETNCPGSAIGDTKLEQWNISYQGNIVLAQAIVDEKVVRAYTGLYSNEILQLQVQQADTAKTPAPKIFVNLRLKSKEKMEGRRIITQRDDCRIVYDLNLDKK